MAKIYRVALGALLAVGCVTAQAHNYFARTYLCDDKIAPSILTLSSHLGVMKERFVGSETTFTSYFTQDLGVRYLYKYQSATESVETIVTFLSDGTLIKRAKFPDRIISSVCQ